MLPNLSYDEHSCMCFCYAHISISIEYIPKNAITEL